MSNTEFIKIINDPNGQLATFLNKITALKANQIKSGTGQFLLAIGSTATSDIPEISAAGATPALRRLTPKIDAEVLTLGQTVDDNTLPVSPAGIVSPVVITRAAVKLAKMSTTVVDCGSFHSPEIPSIKAGSKAARCLSTGYAIDLQEVESLFQAGIKHGEKVGANADYLVLGECVPGGTTTAFAVLKALGHQVEGFISSSLISANHNLKKELIDKGLKNAQLQASSKSTLKIISAVGDPMQPFVAGVALSASCKIPVILAGGSQMLAIWALMIALADEGNFTLKTDMIGIITTKWVAFDRFARTNQLAKLLAAPLAAVCPDFHQSKHLGLRAYEEGHVKEGVGAGGAMAAAYLIADKQAKEILDAIDHSYDELISLKARGNAITNN